MEWTVPKSIDLIDAYKQKTILWDVSDQDYKNGYKRDEGWSELAEEFDSEVGEIKRKMQSLLASYRRERTKTECRGFPSKWFGYDRFEFLREVYTPKRPSNHQDDDDNDVKINVEIDNEDNSNEDPIGVIEFDQPRPLKRINFKRRRRSDEDSEANEPPRKKESRDQLSVFGEYIASELRHLDARSQTLAKHRINKIIFEYQMGMLNGDTKMPN